MSNIKRTSPMAILGLCAIFALGAQRPAMADEGACPAGFDAGSSLAAAPSLDSPAPDLRHEPRPHIGGLGKSILAGGADAATTAIGLAHGAVELNPLGVAAGLIGKPLILWYASRQPEEDQASIYSGATSAWSGAAANNLCVIVGGGVGCIVVGIATAVALWSQNSEERDFWQICKMEKQSNPQLNCVYTPSNRRPS